MSKKVFSQGDVLLPLPSGQEGLHVLVEPRLVPPADKKDSYMEIWKSFESELNLVTTMTHLVTWLIFSFCSLVFTSARFPTWFFCCNTIVSFVFATITK